MAEQGGTLGGMRWALQRPGSGKMEIQVVVEDEAKLSAEVKGALDDLLRALQPEEEVSGYLMAPPSRPGGNPIGFDYDTGRIGFDYDTGRKGATPPPSPRRG